VKSLSDFNGIFQYKPKTRNLIKIHPMIIVVILTDEDTDGQTDEQIRGS